MTRREKQKRKARMDAAMHWVQELERNIVPAPYATGEAGKPIELGIVQLKVALENGPVPEVILHSRVSDRNQRSHLVHHLDGACNMLHELHVQPVGFFG